MADRTNSMTASCQFPQVVKTMINIKSLLTHFFQQLLLMHHGLRSRAWHVPNNHVFPSSPNQVTCSRQMASQHCYYVMSGIVGYSMQYIKLTNLSLFFLHFFFVSCPTCCVATSSAANLWTCHSLMFGT